VSRKSIDLRAGETERLEPLLAFSIFVPKEEVVAAQALSGR